MIPTLDHAANWTVEQKATTPSKNDNGTRILVEEQSRDWVVRLIFIVAMVVFSVAGFIGNSLIIVTIGFIKDLRNTRNIFLVNLALSDLILIAVVVPFNILSVIHGAPFWRDRVTLCLIVASVCAPGCLAAIWSNTAVAVNRFVFICHNDVYDVLFSPKKTILWLVAVWLIAFSIHFPNHVGWGQNGYVDQFYLCTRETDLWTYSLFFGAVGIVLPLTISFYAYLRIYRLVRTTKSAKNRIAARKKTKSNCSRLTPASSTYSVQTPVATLTTPFKPELVSKSKKARKAFNRELLLVRTLFRSFAVFLMAWLPLALMLMIPMSDVPAWIYLMTVFLAHGSTATNSLLYYLTNETFHRGFVKLIRRIRGKPVSYVPSMSVTSLSATSQERIQAADWVSTATTGSTIVVTDDDGHEVCSAEISLADIRDPRLKFLISDTLKLQAQIVVTRGPRRMSKKSEKVLKKLTSPNFPSVMPARP
ncbi:putative Melatonin-related receptor [Hypsibius exemplaris]|uniref:Melatonin-related receptor n=1 Tax=Hypsibius exemplaris TaxID=2072580 RepID=A0A1W0WMD1_HYPEX|nr:putative Melatonin-related receptor [Hypsibius exemplaris]